MGDRANVVIREDWPKDLHDREAVYLYSHWGGHELPETLRRALERGRERWTDGSYLARIVFNEITLGDEESLTGHGISTRLTDNEYDLLVLLPHLQTLVVVPVAHLDEHGLTALDTAQAISFADYIAAPRTWDTLTNVPVP